MKQTQQQKTKPRDVKAG
jgi:hypothetical protein